MSHSSIKNILKLSLTMKYSYFIKHSYGAIIFKICQQSMLVTSFMTYGDPILILFDENITQLYESLLNSLK